MPGSRQEISLIRATPTRPNTWYGDDGETLHLKATRDGLSDFARKLDRFRNANA
jgi:hypothetical protein